MARLRVTILLIDHIGEKTSCFLFVPESDKYSDVVESLLEVVLSSSGISLVALQ